MSCEVVVLESDLDSPLRACGTPPLPSSGLSAADEKISAFPPIILLRKGDVLQRSSFIFMRDWKGATLVTGTVAVERGVPNVSRLK